jgi:formylglycine-generating enzyme required for sulfatase activity
VNAAIAATRAAIETATATLWTPTPTATSTPTEDVLATINAALTATEVYNRASTGVTRNEDWTPIIETFEGVEMVLVPAGCFMMGSNDYDDEQPIHEQCFETPFWIDRYEVTQAQFRQFGGVKANENRFDGDQRPVEQITWFEARDYCALRSVRLPTEAEWEYATLGPSNWVYPWGDDFVAENSVFSENSNSQTVNVGSRPGGASWVGALDMSGNVWEWVSSIYRSYPYDAQGGRENIQDANSARVMRGGSWGDLPINLRVPIRNWVTPDFRSGFNGFRCARSYAAGGFNPRRFTPK